MKSKLLLYSFFSIFSLIASGQASLKSPQICHDNNGFLKCYYDGSYQMEFDRGNFMKLASADSTFFYSVTDKTLTFISVFPLNEPKRRIQIKLLPHSILLSNGSAQKEITVLPDVPTTYEDFGLSTYTVNNQGWGLKLWAGEEKSVTLKVMTWKKWSWDIVVEEGEQRLLIGHDSFHKNRVDAIMIQDDSLRYGMSASMTFKTSKRLWWLKSLYVDSVTENGREVIKAMPLDNPYRYFYKKNGKVNKEKSVGEMRLCECK